MNNPVPNPNPNFTPATEVPRLIGQIAAACKDYRLAKSEARPHATQEVAEVATATYADVASHLKKAKKHQAAGETAQAHRRFVNALNAALVAASEWRRSIPTEEQRAEQEDAEQEDAAEPVAPGFAYSNAESHRTSYEHATVYTFQSGEQVEIYRTKYMSYALAHAVRANKAARREELREIVDTYIVSTAEFRGPDAHTEGAALVQRIVDDVFPVEPEEEPEPIEEPEEEAPPQDDAESSEQHAARVEAFEARKAARIARLEARAANARRRSAAAYQTSREATAGIPFGQPILVGHHSEGRHRNALKRSDSAMRHSVEESEKAEGLARRAVAAASNQAISGDDPDAPAKLRAKLEQLQALQEKMKGANSALRKGDDAALATLGFSESQIATLKAPSFGTDRGFAGFQLTNNNAEIRRTKQRLEQLEQQAQEATTTEQIGEVTITDNVEENRLQLTFPGTPSEAVRKYLKGHGFRWAPSQGAWQRHRSSSATYHARESARLHQEG